MRKKLTEKQKLEKAKEAVLTKLVWFTPTIALTLGSGLGYMVEWLKDAHSISYSEIPHCPIPGAIGHAGKLWWGKLCGVPVIMLQGRVHLYEGYSVHEVVFLTRLMIMLGAKKLLLTHATGAVTRNLEPGDIVAVWNQLSAGCPDPTAGRGIPELGTEFSPIDPVFDPEFLRIAKECALQEKVALHRGVSYFKFGRTYESWAEGEAMARAGADIATMSTIPEIMAAVQMGARVLDLALVIDMVANVRSASEGAVSSDEVLSMAERMKEPFGRLIKAIVPEMAKAA